MKQIYNIFCKTTTETQNISIIILHYLANYLEHEDLERIEKDIYTEGFFNLTDDNIYKSKVIKDIDSNIGQLLKTDAKFFAIHVSPSEKELRAMGNTEQEQAEAMKRYIREVFIPKYAKNFNKELSASNIKFYGKIHFDRGRSDNELNMHCHLIVSRKDQTNKKKLSPLTNHKNTKKGIIKGGFDRVDLFQQVELGFDKLFDYKRQQAESFDYHNTIKNCFISDQLKLQEYEYQYSKRKIELNQENNVTSYQASNIASHIIQNKKSTSTTPASYHKDNYMPSLYTNFLSSKTDQTFQSEEQAFIVRKKKRKKYKLQLNIHS